MNKNKILNIIFCLAYYIFGLIGFYIFGIVAYIMLEPFILFFIIFHIILPIIVLLLPLIIKRILKKDLYKCIYLSMIGVFIYFIIIIIAVLLLTSYSERKWKDSKYIDFRYLMIDELENKYNFIGMKKEEAEEILGKGIGKDELCYQINSNFITVDYYCLKYNDKNIITEIYQKRVD